MAINLRKEGQRWCQHDQIPRRVQRTIMSRPDGSARRPLQDDQERGGSMNTRVKVGVTSAMIAGLLGIATPAFATVVNVGGGTWNYGVGCCKSVWSHYVHPSYLHSATAICGSQNPKIWAGPNQWANSDASCWPWDSTAAYWNIYP